MNKIFKPFPTLFPVVMAGILFIASCAAPQNQTGSTVNANTAANAQPPAVSPAPADEQKPEQKAEQAINLPFTLPVLDAMFSDETFAADLKSKLNLSDDQIQQLRQTAREANRKFRRKTPSTVRLPNQSGLPTKKSARF